VEPEPNLFTKIWIVAIIVSIIMGVVMLAWPRPWTKKASQDKKPTNWKWLIPNKQVRNYFLGFIAVCVFLASPAWFMQLLLIVIVGLLFSVLWRIRNGEILNEIKEKDMLYLNNKSGIKFAVMRLFYNWIRTPKPSSKNSNFQIESIFLFKVLSSKLYFYLGKMQMIFISWLTQYYPFSLLWQDRLFHANNLRVRDLMDEMAVVSKKSGLSIMLYGGGYFSDYSEIEGKFTKRVHSKNESMKKLEKCLQSKYEALYVRNTEKGFKLIIPNDLICPVI
jgi:uncharacterized membrane protein